MPSSRWAIAVVQKTLAVALLAVCAAAAPALAVSPEVNASPTLPASPVPASPVTSAPPAPAGSPVPVGGLVDSLLQAADLPSSLVSHGIATDDAGLDIDLDAFYANGGVSLATQLWQSATADAVAAVFDFRMQFATSEAAAAYLAAAEPTLSERDSSGLVAVPDAQPVGQDSRTYTVVTMQGEVPITFYDYLFHVGPVAAKVFVAGYGTSPQDAAAIAIAAAQRMTVVGPPPTGTPAPLPTPTPTPGPGESGLPADTQLLLHVPSDIASTCQSDPRRFYDGESASLLCYPVSDMYATYTQYDSIDHMTAAFEDATSNLDLGDGSGSCETNPYIGIYTVDGTEAGSVACWQVEAITNILWTDRTTDIMSFGSSDTLDLAGLYAWWLGAGPQH